MGTIAIIGGGFSGTVLAANLLRRPPPTPTRIMLLERRAVLGGGVAYGPSHYPFLLNVPAARMSATSYESAHLVEFARRYLPLAGPESYLPRQLYGEYLREFLQSAERTVPPHVHFERINAEVNAVRPRGDGPLVVVAGEQHWVADQVVLACGDPAAAPRPYAAEIAGSSAYERDPYRARCIRGTDLRVLLIGTGLTMVDVAVAIAAEHPQVSIIAISRHGRLPESQRSPPAPAVLDAQFDPCARLAGRSMRELVAAVRQLVREVLARGGDWREAITRVRDGVPVLWRNLDEVERRRFLRHVRVYWDTHRHRMPPEFARRVDELLGSGQLEVRAGAVRALRRDGQRIVVHWRARGQRNVQLFSVDRVIDCSGLDHRLQRTSDVLWRQLLDAGLACTDALGLGPRTASHGALIAADGRSARRLFYLGPMLRAAHWESTAVGELRVRAEALAAALVSRELAPIPAESDAA
jgi:uncharacterized NAD(P)/FAD-binding protein YdhS